MLEHGENKKTLPAKKHSEQYKGLKNVAKRIN